MSAIIANAPVDLVARVDEAFLTRHAIPRGGTLTVPGKAAMARLLRAFTEEAAKTGGVATHPGGSGANTGACLATLGGRVTLVAPFGTGPHGRLAREDLERRGVRITGFAAGEAHLTVLTAITPDGERSFAVAASAGYPQFAACLPELRREAHLLLDGYLLEDPQSAAAIIAHVQKAMPHGQELIVCPNGAEIITGAREPLRAVLERARRILLSEGEALVLTGASSPHEAAATLRTRGLSGAITLGARGALVFDARDSVAVPARAVAREAIVNMNGAGDAFAAGYLLALQRGLDLAETGALGCACAADVIGQAGARLPA